MNDTKPMTSSTVLKKATRAEKSNPTPTKPMSRDALKALMHAKCAKSEIAKTNRLNPQQLHQMLAEEQTSFDATQKLDAKMISDLHTQLEQEVVLPQLKTQKLSLPQFLEKDMAINRIETEPLQNEQILSMVSDTEDTIPNRTDFLTMMGLEDQQVEEVTAPSRVPIIPITIEPPVPAPQIQRQPNIQPTFF